MIRELMRYILFGQMILSLVSAFVYVVTEPGDPWLPFSRLAIATITLGFLYIGSKKESE
jgi:hypothetical protein